ncbi:hypothetical protein ACFVH6_35290 [Spirillospora sp. NPDC127200]
MPTGVHEPPPADRELLLRHCLGNRGGWLTRGLCDGRLALLPPETRWPDGVPTPHLEYRPDADGRVWWFWTLPGQDAVPVSPANCGDWTVSRLHDLLTEHHVRRVTAS